MSEHQLQTIPSEEATYSDQKSFGVIAGRSHVEVSPKYGGIFKPSDVIRLEIPAQAYLDPNEFYIHFRTQIYAGEANVPGLAAAEPNVQVYREPNLSASYAGNNRQGVQFVPGIQSVFSRVRLLAGSVVLEDITDYNVLYRLLLETTTSKDWRETDGFADEGVYDPEDFHQRTANHNFHSTSLNNGTTTASNQGHHYAIRPLLGLFGAGKYIPLKYMGQLTIELYLEHQNECLWSTSSVTTALIAPGVNTTPRQYWGPVSFSRVPSSQAPSLLNGAAETEHLAVADSTLVHTDFPNATYTIDQVRMHVPFVHPIESFDQAMMRQIESGQIAIYHASWSSHSRQIADTTRQTLSFQERALSLKGCLSVMRNSPAIRAIDSDFCFPANGIQSYQWKLGSEYLPAQEVSCIEGGNRALAELRKGLGLYDNKNVTNMITDYNFLPADLPNQLDSANFTELRRGASQPSSFVMALDLEKSPGQASGFDSAASSVDIELIMRLEKHVSIVQPNLNTAVAGDGSLRYRGAQANTSFQPTKKRVILNNFPYGTSYSGIGWGDELVYATHDNLAEVNRFNKSVRDVPDGFMVDKGLTYAVPAVAQNANPGLYTVTQNSAGQYARVYLFAHIDQVLRLSAIGRMEIVR